MDIQRILIIRFSSIGDIVLTTPVIRAIKTHQPGIEVHYLTQEGFSPILDNNPYLDKVIIYKSLIRTSLELKRQRYDVILDLHNNFRSRIITLLVAAEIIRYKKLNIEKWLMVNFKINRLPNIHVVDRYMETLVPLNIKSDQLGLDYFIPEKDIVETDWIPETHRNGYIVYGIGAQHGTKKLPFEKMIELCAKINKPIILVGDTLDVEVGEKIKDFFTSDVSDSLDSVLKKMHKQTVIFNAAGKFNLNQTASIIKKAEFVFTHDTSIMHIAAAFKKRIFSIWGNTIPLFGMYPYKTKFWIFENKDLECRPCSKIGFNKCPKGHFNCMNGLSFDFYLE